MKQQLLILATFAIGLANCRKKDHPLPAPANNHFLNNGLTHFTPVRLFTHDGEVLNPGLAQAYQNEFPLYFSSPGDVFIDPFYGAIIYMNDDSIRYQTPGRELFAKRTVRDTYDRFSTPYFDISNDTDALEFYMVKYKIFRRKEVTVNSNSYVYYEVDNPVFFLKKVQDTFFMPIIRYAAISRSPGIVKFASGKMNNVFSADGLSHLGANDTLLIQSFDVSFVKEQN